MDIQFEQNKHFNRHNNLDDDQLEDLFNEMKEEVMIKRKIKIEEAKERQLERMEIAGDGLDLEELGGLEDSDDEEVAPQKHFNDNFKMKLQNLRAQKQQQQFQQRSVETNLEQLFSSFQVVNQQQSKMNIEQINLFNDPEYVAEEPKKEKLISMIFSEINPFSSFVIQEMMAGKKDEQPKEEELWHLSEDMFKDNSNQAVNPDHLKKTSSQMYGIYKYLGDPSLLVKNELHTSKADFVEVKELMPGTKFFDMPESTFTEAI